LFAAHPELLTPLQRIVHRVITGFLLEQAGLKRSAAYTGAVTLIQRFGSAGNLDIHLHCLVLDGVHRCTEGEPLFDEARAPSGDDLEGLLDKLIARVMKMLTRKGYLPDEQGITYLADIDADNPLASLQAPSCTYRIALGPRAGQKVLSLRTVISQQKRHTAVLCADAHGFSLHVAVAAHQRKERERLCRYMPDAAQQTSEPAQDQDHAHGQSARMSWARLLRRVFDIDVAHCVCGGALKIIAAIEDPVVIARILTHLGLPARAPPRSPARSAPRTHAA